MSARLPLRRFFLSAACAALSSPAFAGFVTGRGRASDGGVQALTPSQALALGAPGADRIGFVTLSGAGAGDPVAFGPVSAMTLRNAAADPSRILGLLNGDASSGVNYMGEAFDPFTAAFIDAGLSSVDRAYALLFDAAGGPIDYGLGGAPLFAGEPAGPFTPPPGFGARSAVVGGIAPERVQTAETPLPAGLGLLVAAMAGLGWASRRRSTG